MKRDKKKKLMTKHGQHEKDTGSAQVQIAILTERIQEVQDHLADHNKDNHSSHGLLKMVGKRRQLLNYLRLNDKNGYEDTVKKLKLRK